MSLEKENAALQSGASNVVYLHSDNDIQISTTPKPKQLSRFLMADNLSAYCDAYHRTGSPEVLAAWMRERERILYGGEYDNQ